MSRTTAPLSPKENATSPVYSEKDEKRALLNTARNPISLRLYKVLGANYDDSRAKEALETLSAYYTSPVTTLPKQTEHTDFDPSDQIVKDNKPCRDYARDTAARARKSLRRDTEARLTEGSQRFLKAFGGVDDKLNLLEDFIQEMVATCNDAEVKLRATTDVSKHLLDKAEGLRQQRQQMGTRLSMVNIFLAEFTLTEEQTEIMTSRDIPVGRQMFETIDHVENIRERCQMLLSEESSTNAGLDIMSVTSSLLDQAYQKIYRWCSSEFRRLVKDAQLEVDTLVKEGIKRLKHQPDLYSQALKTLSQTRQSALLSQFLDALSRGGPSGFPRPIEIHAHDPTRYIGDMLGWIHQAVAGEHEFLSGLFDIRDDGRMVGSIRKIRQQDDDERWVRLLLDESIEKILMPLRLRIQQTIKSQESSITSFKIANILQFYLITMRRTIGDDALLCTTLGDITDLAYKTFFDAVEAQGRSLLRYLHPPEEDLSPPFALRDFCQVLREIMTVYESSVLNAENPEEQKQGFKRILDTVLDPALEMCRRMAEMNTRDKTGWEKNIFLINCLDYLQSVMQPYPFTNERIEELETLLQQRVKQLIEQHCTQLLQESGLARAIGLIEVNDGTVPLSRLPETTPSEITAALRTFDTFLSELDVVSSPRLVLLTVPRLAALVHRSSLEKLGNYYAKLCEAIKDPKNKYEFASTLLGSQRPFGQMDVLWQVIGVEGSV